MILELDPPGNLLALVNYKWSELHAYLLALKTEMVCLVCEEETTLNNYQKCYYHPA
jgi:hypothetical protein